MTDIKRNELTYYVIRNFNIFMTIIIREGRQKVIKFMEDFRTSISKIDPMDKYIKNSELAIRI